MLDALLRFGPLGIALLLCLPLALAARYAFGRTLLSLTTTSRPPDDEERAALTDALDAAGLAGAEVVVVTGVDERVAGLSGTPRERLVVLSEATLTSATEAELAGLAGLAAGKDAVRLPELYAAYLVGASLAFATLLGVDPSGFGSPWVAGALALSLLAVVLLGFPALRRATHAADRTATDRVGADAVRAGLAFLDDSTGPDWLPEFARPRPSVARRLDRL